MVFSPERLGAGLKRNVTADTVGAPESIFRASRGSHWSKASGDHGEGGTNTIGTIGHEPFEK